MGEQDRRQMEWGREGGVGRDQMEVTERAGSVVSTRNLGAGIPERGPKVSL